MTHVDEGAIQARLSGELTPEAAVAMDRHLAECGGCREAVAQVRQEDAWVRERLSVLDVAPAAPDLARLRHEVHRRKSLGIWRRAAAIVLVSGAAGVAWAIPAVRTFVGRALGGSGGRVVSPATPAPAPDSMTSGVPTNGVAVVPGARYVIVFDAFQSAGHVRIRLVSGAEVSVVAREVQVAFESRQDSLMVRNQGTNADYAVEIPVGAALVELRTSGRQLFMKRGASVTATGPLGSDGWYTISLRPGPP